MHGAAVITRALLPVGQLSSEEAAEARNKHFRQYRQNSIRKFSRVDCNTDVINRLQLSSDPYTSIVVDQNNTKTALSFSQEAVETMISSTYVPLCRAESDSEQDIADENDESS